jgi:hypothetical protein
MKLNKKPVSPTTHGGAKAQSINSSLELKRSVMACLLWEDSFYENGEDIGTRIASLIPKVDADVVANIAIEAREKMKLRHVPLLIVREMARLKTHKHLVAQTLARVIQRPDELCEFVAIYWKEKKQPLSGQVKKGLAQAFTKFNEYSLAKYNRDGAIKLRDVLFLCHAKPLNQEQAAVFKQLVDNTLPIPDTWEVSLSSGKDKKETWSRLLKENKLGSLALLRNLRNMKDVNVNPDLVKNAILNMKTDKILPFRFISAAKAAPDFEPELDKAFLSMLSNQTKIPGKTVVIIDVSGSMYGAKVSAKSDMDRAQAACSLAAITREICEDPVIYATAGSDMARTHQTKKVAARRGMSLVDAVYGMCQPLGGGGIFLKQVMDYVIDKEKTADNVIVITDEQDCDIKGSPSEAKLFDGANHFMINVSNDKNGIGYGKWTHIDGWSEAVVNYIKKSI